MAKLNFDQLLLVAISITCLLIQPSSAQLRQNYYSKICPNVESIVRNAVTQKFQQTIVTVPGTLRLFFHDCFVNGCDASVMVASTANNNAEKDSSDNLSLAGDGFDTVIKAKAAVDAVAQCRNKVSCADILTMAARDVISLAGGPSFVVELGRLDGLVSTAASVNGKLPQPNFNLNQLNSLFAANGLSQTDMIALSAAHTLGFSHCNRFANRIYDFGGRKGAIDPSLNQTYAKQLQGMCPRNVDPNIAINMDPITPRTFDNLYFSNLQQRMGLFTSDQSLADDSRSRPTVDTWAANSNAFNNAFIAAMTRLGRVGVKTSTALGNIRRDCSVFN
ncbi:peroxidase 51-like [Phalaenopsis equestris]|uniref:peroxidase 51-like n=1 Tax=Phalaenopsis equestris TaxID=78828 RepID=UPI0009E43C3B|nr:peroxidase 51-like [Phalaenopsis equestris]